MRTNKEYKKNRGFTLIELMTALSIFVVIMTISMGSIIGVFDANRRSKSIKAVMSNLNLTMETMSKELRYGRHYHCEESGTLTSPQNCPEGGTFISFLSSDDEQISYQFSGGSIEKQVDAGDPIAITVPEVVDDLTFYVLGAGTDDTLQPKVVIKIKGHAGTGDSRSDFTLQTLVSQRFLDIDSSEEEIGGGGGGGGGGSATITYTGPVSGSQNLSLASLSLTTPGTYSISSSDSLTITVQCWAGGGGGGAVGQSPGYRGGGGGGGGGYVRGGVAVTASVPYTLVVGAGGSAGLWAENNESQTFSGGDGGNSTFGSLVAYGGTGGEKGSLGGDGGTYGQSSGGSSDYRGGRGGDGASWNGTNGGAGGGGGGAGSGGNGSNGSNGPSNSPSGGSGGDGGSPDGGDGGNGNYNGTVAQAPSGGGGGGNPNSGSAVHGLVGARGQCGISL